MVVGWDGLAVGWDGLAVVGWDGLAVVGWDGLAVVGEFKSRSDNLGLFFTVAPSFQIQGHAL